MVTLTVSASWMGLSDAHQVRIIVSLTVESRGLVEAMGLEPMSSMPTTDYLRSYPVLFVYRPNSRSGTRG